MLPRTMPQKVENDFFLFQAQTVFEFDGISTPNDFLLLRENLISAERLYLLAENNRWNNLVQYFVQSKKQDLFSW